MDAPTIDPQKMVSSPTVHVAEFEVIGKDDVAADIREHGERARGNDGAADGQAVEAVGEIHRVRRAGENDDHPKDERKIDENWALWNAMAPCHSRSGCQDLMKGTFICVEYMRNCCRITSERATPQAASAW